MFGAYQAGAWKALAGHFRPDLIVGASAGALNGWALAGGCSPAELIAVWRDPATAGLMQRRFPVQPWRSFFDPDPLTRWVNQYFAQFQPRMPYASTMVEVPRLRQVLVRGEQHDAGAPDGLLRYSLRLSTRAHRRQVLRGWRSALRSPTLGCCRTRSHASRSGDFILTLIFTALLAGQTYAAGIHGRALVLFQYHYLFIDEAVGGFFGKLALNITGTTTIFTQNGLLQRNTPLNCVLLL